MSTPARKARRVYTVAEIVAAEAFVFPADRFHALAASIYHIEIGPRS